MLMVTPQRQVVVVVSSCGDVVLLVYLFTNGVNIQKKNTFFIISYDVLFSKTQRRSHKEMAL